MRIGSPPAAYALLAAIGVVACAGQASAQQVCSALTGNKIYGVGGSAQTPLIGQIASKLRAPADSDDQLTIIYAQPGACFAMSAFDPEASEAERAITATPTGTAALYWDQGNATGKPCVLDAGQLADFSTMQQYPELCPGVEGLHDGLGDFLGPIGTVNVIVPTASSQNSISSEAIYFLFKLGEEGGVEPWTNMDYLTRRTRTSAVQLQLLKAAGLLESSGGDITFGWDAETNGKSVATVANEGLHNEERGFPAVTVRNAEATIGFVSGENAENARDDGVRTLAYQHFGQECAYWPDSSSTAFDKLNVRTGRYFLWGALHFYAPVTGADSAIEDIGNAGVQKLVGYFTGATPPPAELPLLDTYIDNFNVPQCAMQVSRDEDLGPISSFQPDEPCGCYFEARATGRTSCEECEEDTDCPSSDPVCRFGYCEVQ